MATLNILDRTCKQVGTYEIDPTEIAPRINKQLLHDAVVMYQANQRQGTFRTKSRAEVAGSTKKMYRQKGTGRARHGSRNAPIFVGGGQAHGPIPHKYTKDMPKKMHRQALRNALSAAILDEQVVIVESLSLKAAKTKDFAKVLKTLVGESSALVLLAEANENVQSAISNLDSAFYLRASYLNVRDLLTYDKVIVPLDALNVLTSWLGTEG